MLITDSSIDISRFLFTITMLMLAASYGCQTNKRIITEFPYSRPEISDIEWTKKGDQHGLSFWVEDEEAGVKEIKVTHYADNKEIRSITIRIPAKTYHFEPDTTIFDLADGINVFTISVINKKNQSSSIRRHTEMNFACPEFRTDQQYSVKVINEADNMGFHSEFSQLHSGIVGSLLNICKGRFRVFKQNTPDPTDLTIKISAILIYDNVFSIQVEGFLQDTGDQHIIYIPNQELRLLNNENNSNAIKSLAYSIAAQIHRDMPLLTGRIISSPDPGKEAIIFDVEFDSHYSEEYLSQCIQRLLPGLDVIILDPNGSRTPYKSKAKMKIINRTYKIQLSGRGISQLLRNNPIQIGDPVILR